MPVIEIQSSPMTDALAARLEVATLQQRFCRLTDLPGEQVTFIWRIAERGRFAQGGTTALAESAQSLALVATVTAPDWHGQGVVERMLRAVSQALEDELGVPRQAVLVMYRPLRSGQVLDGGRLLEWDDA